MTEFFGFSDLSPTSGLSGRLHGLGRRTAATGRSVSLDSEMIRSRLRGVCVYRPDTNPHIQSMPIQLIQGTIDIDENGAEIQVSVLIGQALLGAFGIGLKEPTTPPQQIVSPANSLNGKHYAVGSAATVLPSKLVIPVKVFSPTPATPVPYFVQVNFFQDERLIARSSAFSGQFPAGTGVVGAKFVFNFK